MLAGVLISSGREPYVLRAENLSGIRGTEKLFRDISFDLTPGRLIWLRGQNGSGKTTLLRLLTGIAKPEAGCVTWNGKVLEKSETFHEELLYLGHSNGLKDDLTALEALQFLVKIHGDDGDLVILENALRQLGIFHRRHLPVRTLSQGQRKRVALARLVAASRPRVWVLDEPFDAIDDGGIGIVTRLLETHIGQGGCVILTSHIPLVMKDFKIETLQMETGRIT